MRTVARERFGDARRRARVIPRPGSAVESHRMTAELDAPGNDVIAEFEMLIPLLRLIAAPFFGGALHGRAPRLRGGTSEKEGTDRRAPAPLQLAAPPAPSRHRGSVERRSAPPSRCLSRSRGSRSGGALGPSSPA